LAPPSAVIYTLSLHDALPIFSIAQIVGEGLRVHNLSASEAERRQLIEDTLAEVGLDPAAAERYPHEFSGGQRQRIAIARALVLRSEEHTSELQSPCNLVCRLL